MSAYDQEISNIENSITELKEVVKLGKAVKALKDNADFQQVVLETYFKKESIRLVTVLSHPGLTAEMKEDVTNQMLAIGGLKRFFETQITLAGNAERAILRAEEEVTEMRQLDLAGVQPDEIDEDYNNTLGA